MRQCLLNVEHERFGLGETGGLDDDDVGLDALDDFIHRRFKLAEQRAANAAAAKLGDPHVFALDHFRVDCDLAKFIHHDSDFRRARREDMPEQRGLAASEWAGDESDGSARLHFKNPSLVRLDCLKQSSLSGRQSLQRRFDIRHSGLVIPLFIPSHFQSA